MMFSGSKVLVNTVIRESFVARRGIFSRIRQTLEDRKMKQQRDQQEQQKDNIVKALKELDMKQRYNLGIYQSQLEQAVKQGTEGWSSMIPGAKEYAGIPEVQNLLTITKGMTEKELKNHSLITPREVKRIAHTSGQPKEKVDALMQQYSMVRTVDGWMKERVRRGKEVPDSLDEIFKLMLTDKTGIPAQGNLTPLSL